MSSDERYVIDRARLGAPLPEKIGHLVTANLVEVAIAKEIAPRLIDISRQMVSFVFSRQAVR
jgi:hypothetical protein